MAKFKATPPKLVKGRGITRWMAVRDVSVLEIPEFENTRRLWTPDSIPDQLTVWERKPGHPNFGKELVMSKEILLASYGPSSLQKFSDESYLVRDPYHVSWHKMIKRRERVGQGKDQTGADIVMFTRYGARWDSLDDYYVKKAFYAGLAWN